jgi:hypothetical protein
LNWTVIVDTDDEPAAIFTAAVANRQKAFSAQSEGVNPVPPFVKCAIQIYWEIGRNTGDKLSDHLNTDRTFKKIFGAIAGWRVVG